jgi:hypothetical protein
MFKFRASHWILQTNLTLTCSAKYYMFYLFNITAIEPYDPILHQFFYVLVFYLKGGLNHRT